MADYFVRFASKDEAGEIVALIDQSFYPEETILQSYVAKNRDLLTPEDCGVIRDVSNKILEFLLADNASLVAVHRETGRIIGTVVLIPHDGRRIVPAERVSKFVEAEVMKSRFTSELFYYLDMLSGKATVFEVFPEASKFLKLSFLGVDREHRGKGISTELLRQCLEWAKSNGFEIVFGTFSSIYSQRAGEKLGMKSVVDHDLPRFKNFEGQQIFADRSPHNIIRVMTKNFKDL